MPSFLRHGAYAPLVRLPTETTAGILKYLPQRDLRRAAATCRRIRSVALSCCGLCLTLGLHCPDISTVRGVRLDDALDHASAHGLPVDLEIDCICRFASEWHTESDLLELVESAVPLLVRFKLWFAKPDCHYDVVDEILSDPAPNLRELTTNCLSSSPEDLLFGRAPRLTTLVLGTRLEFDCAVPAFSAVRDLAIELGDMPVDIPLAVLFPVLQRLAIYSKSPRSRYSRAPNLRGLNLSRLMMQVRYPENNLLSSLAAHIAFAEITHICLYGTDFDWPPYPAVLDGMTGDIDVRVHGFDHWSEMTLFFPDLQRWRTSWFDIFWEPDDDRHPLQELAGMASRLRSLRLDAIHLHGLWALGCPLPALQFLHIDLASKTEAGSAPTLYSLYCDMYVEGSAQHDNINSPTPDIENEGSWVHCGCLNEVRIVAAHSVPVAVKSLEFALLGLALGQKDRESSARAKLVLSGVTFSGQVQHDLLDQVFSAVDLRELAECDFDGDRWNVCLDRAGSDIPWKEQYLYSYSPFLYLPEDDLRCAAGTSRHLRTVALQNAGLCRNSSRLREVIEYIRSEHLTLDLAVDCFFLPKTEQISFVSACLADALPYLAKLSVVFFRGFPAETYAALRQPAPQLRELSMRGSPDAVLDAVVPAAALFPIDLLSNTAPRLTTLELHDLFLSAPMDIFKRVRTLSVTYASAIPRLDFSWHFPAVRDLEIRCVASRVLPGEPPALDFRGTALNRLTLEAGPSLMLELDQQLAHSSRVIPVVLRSCEPGKWGASTWETFTETLNMRILRVRYDKAEAAVVSSGLKLCRIHWLDYYEETNNSVFHCPLLVEFKILANRLVYIRIDTRFVPELLDFGCTMPVLRRLQLDLDGDENTIWPPYHEDVDEDDDIDSVDPLFATRTCIATTYSYIHCAQIPQRSITFEHVRLPLESYLQHWLTSASVHAVQEIVSSETRRGRMTGYEPHETVGRVGAEWGADARGRAGPAAIVEPGHRRAGAAERKRSANGEDTRVYVRVQAAHNRRGLMRRSRTNVLVAVLSSTDCKRKDTLWEP
ncbi:hypothetical protein AURDEDRAFT_125225 [Auricularia subglabra TFB-10046 SS5]|nr:hypothetical protein AURDEDRAFT_125225 [Auricularia subglabra TFB-10046 SS5]